MTTKPYENLLYRELSNAIARPVINVASPLLKELVDYSTNAYIRCSSTDDYIGEENEDLAVFILYLHIIEMTDAIEVLVSQSCSIPAFLLLRSNFEALLSMEYILENDYTTRSLSYLAEYIRQRLESYNRDDPNTSQGKEFQKHIANDIWGTDLPLPSIDEVKEWQSNYGTLLNDPQFQDIQNEYRRIKRNRKRRPNWYNLFGGPSNLRQLAIDLDRGGQYEVLYRSWSRITHGIDISRFLGKDSEGEHAIKALRDPNRIKTTTILSSAFIVTATSKMLEKFRPGETWGDWYGREVRPLMNRL